MNNLMLPIIYQRLGPDPAADAVTEIQVAEVITTTHKFTLLSVAHASDTKAIGGHDWDLEGILLVEGADGLEGMWTQAHFDWNCYAGLKGMVLSQARRPLEKVWETLARRPVVWIEAKGHGIYGHAVGDDPTKKYDDYVPVSMFGPTGLWIRRKELFTQNEHGRWMRGGAHAPWSWASRMGYPGLVAFDPATFCLESGVQGWSPVSRQYTLNQFLEIGGTE